MTSTFIAGNETYRGHHIDDGPVGATKQPFLGDTELCGYKDDIIKTLCVNRDKPMS
ncbi:MAG: hypothetical protein ABIQ31_15510 [Ferruginibacter sp.]